MPVSVGSATLDRINRYNEEQKKLADYSDSQSDINKMADESSMGDDGSWHSVYKPTTVAVKYESKPGMGKYVNSLKHLLPVRVKTGPGSFMPVDMTGCFAFTFFSWLTPLVWRTFRHGLGQSDLYHCSPFDSCRINGARFKNMWEKQVKKHGLHKASLSHALFKFERTRFFFACAMYIACVAFGFIGPTLFMRLLLEYIQKPEIDDIEGATWMTGLILCELFRIFFFSLMWAVNIRTAVRSAAAIRGLLYKKVMHLQSISSTSAGELVNLFANDCQKVFMMIYNAPLIIGGPLVIVGAVIYTWLLFGPYCFIGVAVFVFTYVFQFCISYLIAFYRRRAIKATDERVSLMTEFLSNIKLIKLYAWEKHLIEFVRDARSTERDYLEKGQYIQTFSSSITTLSSILATIFTILAYTMSGSNLSPAEAFTLVMVNTIASHGIQTLPMCIRDIVNGRIALKRLQTVLHLEEKENYITVPNSLNVTINMSNATLDWEPTTPNLLHCCSKPDTGEVNLTVGDHDKHQQEEISADTALVPLTPEAVLPPALTDIDFVLQEKKLVGVCGAYGSGKSSLIASLLGQMRLLKGQVSVRGSIAYVSQEPWILNESLRENVLFGQLFSSKRYYEAVYCCGLSDDIAALPAGDQTEVGEKGINLSGGQKQRISLARAQYADRDLYLLDDPLSAVDNQVGRHIFQHCIKGALKDKSVLFVTHQLKYLEECDSILFMRGGSIVEHGTHEELMKKGTEYSALVEIISKNEKKVSESGQSSSSSSPQRLSPSRRRSLSQSPSMSSMSDLAENEYFDGHLTVDEKLHTGNVSGNTYIAYIQAAGGFIVCTLVFVWFIVQSASTAFSKYWLSHWLAQGNGNHSTINVTESDAPKIEALELELPNITDNPDIGFYQLIYGLSVVAMFLISLILGFLFTKTSLRASSGLHDRMLLKVFRSPMHFFETTPAGRILNIFTHDTDETDTNVPSVMSSFLQRIMTVIFTLLLISIVYHWFVIPLLVLAVCFFFLQRLFRAVMRDLKRFENVSRSPVFSHVTASVHGLSTIKAYQKEESFFDRFTQLVDQHSSPQYLYYCSMRWLGIRMDFLGLLITLVTSLFVVFLKGEVNPAFAALALALTMQLSGMYQYVVRLGCDLETRFTSVERIQSYAEELETEAPLVIDKTRPSPDWPTRGRITFLDVKLRYRPGLPLALKGLTFNVEPQEKIGIVGRTGSGKSSVGTALFRLVELASGSIFIDGVNIQELGLEDLRSRMSIIPQDPVLFQGTVRYNLDPMTECEDSELWQVLEKADMKGKVSSLDGGLDATVAEGGSNFSVGEKQLLCMARALLRQSKVVLLDEATASVDGETDRIIQKALMEVFATSTVLTIAHRLSTVINCDRVIVLSEGKIVEFDKPSVLSSNPKSHLSILLSAENLTKL